MHPEDVAPESGCRLPLPRREQLDDAGRWTYDMTASPTPERNYQGAEGPSRYLLQQSRTLATCPAAQPLSAARGAVGERVRELAILTTAPCVCDGMRARPGAPTAWIGRPRPTQVVPRRGRMCWTFGNGAFLDFHEAAENHFQPTCRKCKEAREAAISRFPRSFPRT